MPRLALFAALLPLLLASASLASEALPPTAPRADSLADEAEVERLPAGYLAVSPTVSLPARDPLYGQPTRRAIGVYREGPGGFQRVVTIRFEPEDGLRARQAARLCARLLRLHAERFGREARFPQGAGQMNLWLLLVPNRGAGGETRAGNLYVFGTASLTSDLEFVRTIAHEWGHATLPAARGFSAPENDAAGFLGERLYLRWLSEDSPAPDDAARPADLARYDERQSRPLADAFRASGPDPLRQRPLDGAQMDRYVGAALAAEDAFGSAALGRALFSVQGVMPIDFLRALAQTLAARKETSIRLPAWVPLTTGVYRITPEDGAGAVTIDGRTIGLGGPKRWTPRRRGFVFFRPLADRPARIRLERLR